ncbi:cyclic nucleotide-binding domain-containing protein, partial [Actinomadura adrarensis]
MSDTLRMPNAFAGSSGGHHWPTPSGHPPQTVTHDGRTHQAVPPTSQVPHPTVPQPFPQHVPQPFPQGVPEMVAQGAASQDSVAGHAVTHEQFAHAYFQETGAQSTAGAAVAETGRFWRALTLEEQHALISAATSFHYPIGTVLWQEGEVADHLVVITSGYVRVSVVRGGQERIIAFRGPGDIIGERAALLLRRRSAGIVAMDDVRTLKLTTGEF